MAGLNLEAEFFFSILSYINEIDKINEQRVKNQGIGGKVCYMRDSTVLVITISRFYCIFIYYSFNKVLQVGTGVAICRFMSFDAWHGDPLSLRKWLTNDRGSLPELDIEWCITTPVLRAPWLQYLNFQEAEFNWSPFEVGILLGIQGLLGIFGFIGGYLSCKYGGVKIFGGSICIQGIIALISPLVVRWGVPMFAITRMLESLFCVIQILWSYLPYSEKYLLTLTNSNISSGYIICCLPASICQMGSFKWKISYGGLFVDWILFWCRFGISSVWNHNRVLGMAICVLLKW